MSDIEKEKADIGELILVATPIGNLEDMTYRAIRTLKEADIIAAEDTRNSQKLMNHFEISTHMTSYHEYNKIEKAVVLIDKMRNGATVALITDAGMPGISDPGEELVRMCHEEGMKVTVVPGATASVSALALSGLPSRRFVFEGFLPTKKKEQKEVLDSIVNETRTMIFYEAPHRLLKTLKILSEILEDKSKVEVSDENKEENKKDCVTPRKDRKIAICKELTKRYESVNVMTISEALAFYEDNPPRGEYVIVIEGKNRQELIDEEQNAWENLSIVAHMEIYLKKGLDKKEAMKAVAKDRGVSKRDIYQALL
jgi:16S rRNA (cytidine1402-2'-O)-methyltransferase